MIVFGFRAFIEILTVITYFAFAGCYDDYDSEENLSEERLLKCPGHFPVSFETEHSNITFKTEHISYGHLNVTIIFSKVNSSDSEPLITLQAIYLAPKNTSEKEGNARVNVICNEMVNYQWQKSKGLELMGLMFGEMIDMGFVVDYELFTRRFVKNLFHSKEFWYVKEGLTENDCFPFKFHTKIESDNPISTGMIPTSEEEFEIDSYIVCFFPVYSNFEVLSDSIDNIGRLNFDVTSAVVALAFKMLTIIMYMSVPQLRQKVYGKCIVLYFISNITLYLSILVTVQIDPYTAKWKQSYFDFCIPVGFFIQYVWLTTFTLQNVICYDILGAFRSTLGKSKRTDKSKMHLYCLYAYGLAAVITLFTCFLQFSSILEDNSTWRPLINGDYCFFPNHPLGKINRILYMYGPYCIMIISSIIMASNTAVQIYKRMKGLNDFTRSSFRKNTPKNQETKSFQVHIKLFFVMGLNWLICDVVILTREFFSSYGNWPWVVANNYNNIIGLDLFVVLFFNTNIVKKLKSKFSRKKVGPFELQGRTSDLDANTSVANQSLSNDTELSNL